MTDITEANVDFVIQEVIKKYFDKGMLIDAMDKWLDTRQP